MDPVAPFFSVVIPAYNRARVLPGAIDPVLQQTDQDFEIIVVDDGSTDNPRAVVEDFQDPRIRYEWKENGGGGSARNRGIDRARGGSWHFSIPTTCSCRIIWLPCAASWKAGRTSPVTHAWSWSAVGAARS